jgi:hypothetical protein
MRSANFIEIESDPTLEAVWGSNATPIHTPISISTMFSQLPELL